MKKLKISELPLCSTFAGLFTIGVDNLNRSVKVSLQFVEDKVKEAVAKAQAATLSADTAAQEAQTAKTATDKATSEAQAATKAAQTAITEAEKATASANSAALSASQKADDANIATEQASTAAATANEASASAQEATTEARAAKMEADRAAAAAVSAAEQASTAASDAKAAANYVLSMIDKLIPSSLAIDAPKRINLGMKPVAIKSVLLPDTAMRNLIYLSDNKAVEVSTDGIITPVAKGTSRVNVIPTLNTALARTCIIEVEEPLRIRMLSTSSMRFNQSGSLRLI